MKWFSIGGRGSDSRVKSFDSELAARGGVANRLDAGYHTVPTDRIVGSVSRARELRADFLRFEPPRYTERHERIAAALAASIPLPPLELYRISAGAAAAHEYFVVDGHHRVAVARRIGQDFLDAHVVDYRVRPALSG